MKPPSIDWIKFRCKALAWASCSLLSWVLDIYDCPLAMPIVAKLASILPGTAFLSGIRAALVIADWIVKRSLLESPDDMMCVVVLISPDDYRSSMPTWLLLGTLKMHRGAVLLFSSSERGKMYAH